MLHLGIELRTGQDGGGGDPEPGHEADRAPREPYVSLNLQNLAAYQENSPEATSHRIVAITLPQVIQWQHGASRLGPNR